MNAEIENLKFDLKEKRKELRDLTLNTFTYNPKITTLAAEVIDLENKIIDLGGAVDEIDN